jgi:hypothetical protein
MVFNPLENHNANMVMSLPIEFMNKESTIKYPIHVACECDYEIFVDGKFVDQTNKEVNIIENVFEGHPGWNATKLFSPIINTKSPNIIAFHGTGGQFSGFQNGFVMDMNNGADYTKYQEWKCKEFAVSIVPTNWYSYDYDDSLWEMSKSFGMNYQNNSFQIFERERANIHLNAEWLWTQDNSKTNVFCRRKYRHVQTIPLRTTTPAPITTSTSVLKTTHHIPGSTAVPTHEPTHMSVLKTIHHIPASTAVPTAVPSHVSVLKTIHHIPVPTALPSHASVLKTIHHIPAPTAASTAVPSHASVLKTLHHIPASTAASTAAPSHASVLKTIHHIPVPSHASVLKTIHHIPVPTAAPTAVPTAVPTAAPTEAHLIKPEIQNIYNIKNNIKIIINNAKVSKNIIDKHVFNIFHYLDSIKNDRSDRSDMSDRNNNDNNKLYRELYYIVKQTHTHIQNHYDDIVDYYKKLLRDTYDHHDNDYEGSDEYESGEKQEKREKQENVNNRNRFDKSSKIIKSMIKLNHYIKVIEYKINFIKGATKYNLLKILYSLKKQYQDDMIQMLQYL